VNQTVRRCIGDAIVKETARERLKSMAERRVPNNSRHAFEHVRNDRMDVIYVCDAAESSGADPARKGRRCLS